MTELKFLGIIKILDPMAKVSRINACAAKNSMTTKSHTDDFTKPLLKNTCLSLDMCLSKAAIHIQIFIPGI